MYKLVITSRKGPGKKVEFREYWMTQLGLHQAEEEFVELQHRQEVVRLVLWRQDLTGTYVLRWWKRE
jgi:hypothetical protein